ncbi:MAG TPA: transcription-repair coupling factor [Gammaproteobacteria bacterium]|nr:transcription-repair coupling factor [Gammaproteobacteria bacterium]
MKNTTGSELSLYLSQHAEGLSTPLIIITPDSWTNIRLTQEIGFFNPALPIFTFPDWETLPYDNFSPHQDIISERLRTLSKLPHLSNGIVLVSINSLMQKLPPKAFIDTHAFIVKIRDKINLDNLKNRFVLSGYQSVSQVLAPGEFAVRGSLFDIFPMGSETPYRIDLFDNEIESIRTFDPESQRTKDKIDSIDLLPAREFPFDTQAIDLFRQQWRENFDGNPSGCAIYETISQGSVPLGIEYYLPLFFKEVSSLLDYFPKNISLIQLDGVTKAAEKFQQEINTRHEQLRHDRMRPILIPQKLFISPTEIFTTLKNYSVEKIQSEKYVSPDILVDHKASQPLEKLKSFLENHNQSRILFCAESAGRREALLSLFRSHGINPAISNTWQEFLQSTDKLVLTIAPLEQGLLLENKNIILIPESALLGEQIIQSRRKKSKTGDMDSIVKNLAELNIGAPVVHVEHGVGRYLGLQTLEINNSVGEYLLLEYAHDAKLYIPVSSLHLIHRYSGLDADHAPLHKLGSDQWDKAKKRAAEKIRDVAAELLAIHAQRELRKGFAYTIDTNYQLFASQFPFEETPDQLQAINDVIKDMNNPKSMDRLICGDVGFGKTEVAMRAAFIAVQAGHQVCVLVPTTLLAQQHYQNFADRFADWPIKIEMVSRFKTSQEQTKILAELENGKVDIIIGTHKLLQPDIKFKHLGLVIIDEEHRFGVRQKEKLKSLRAEVDILTLTATPIPRTLNMAMSGMRDLSIIGTPPLRRLSIKTFVHVHDKSLIRESILREIMRGGQVFYLHNDVESMIPTAERLRELIPEARIAIAHGQMRERELEIIMREFYHQHYNVLICTTIIETGIDIPSANTIIIERADKFGLAQLHQLRGRVGRSHHQAYAFLLTPPHQKITPDAEKRLEAISRLEDLGVGFALATHDLEIRGAGELLGESQSGEMHEIGFSLYMELLERAMKSGIPEQIKSDIDLQIPAFITEDYVPDVHARLVLYKRISSCKDQHKLDELQVEFIDRFGLLPEPTKNLFAVTALKLKSEHLGIKKITANIKSTRIEFSEKPNIDSLKIIKLIQTKPLLYKLDGPHGLKILQKESVQGIEMLFGLLS